LSLLDIYIDQVRLLSSVPSNAHIDDFFEFQPDSGTRGHVYKLFKPRCFVIFVEFFLLSVL